MKSLYPTASWLTLAAAALLFALAASNVHAQTRIVRPATTSFPTVGNPRWYTQTNWSSYSNPNNYVNYSYLNTYYNPFPRYYPTYVPYVYPTYTPSVYPVYNPYATYPYGYVPYGYNPYAYAY